MSTDLQTTDNNGLQWVKPTAQNSVIAKALLSPLVNQVSPEEVFKVLNVAIAKSYIDTGFKAPDASNQAEAMIYSQMVNELVYYIRQYAATYRLKELPIAIERGTQKEYGDYFGLNKTSFIQFIKGYKASEARAQALEPHLKSLSEPQVIPTASEQFDTAKSNALQAFEAHKNKTSVDRMGGVVYDFLNSIGLITYSTEQKKEIFVQATKKVIDEAEAHRLGSDFFIRQSLLKLIETFKAVPTEGTKEHGIIVAKAKYITLCKYFDALLLVNADLQGILESKRETFITLKS